MVAALDNYKDMSKETRDELRAKMSKQKFDDVVIIRRESIKGKEEYLPQIRDMHFGKNKVCNIVTRAKWTDKAEQRALVYCAREECIVVPLICRNVSRITRRYPGVIVPPTTTYVEPPVPQWTPAYMPPGTVYGNPPPNEAWAYGGGYSRGFYYPPRGGWGPPGYPQGIVPPVVTIPPVVTPPVEPPVIVPPIFPPIDYPPVIIPPDGTPPNQVPEPQTYLLFLLGIGAMLFSRRKNK
jgi:hypothetical protein